MKKLKFDYEVSYYGSTDIYFKNKYNRGNHKHNNYIRPSVVDNYIYIKEQMEVYDNEKEAIIRLLELKKEGFQKVRIKKVKHLL